MEITPIFNKSYFLTAGEVNAEGELSITLLITRIIDIATEHANSLGIGNPDMRSFGGGWVLSRLTIEMQRYPMVNEAYSLSTWITVWNRHFSERCFCIYDNEGNPLGYARSIWMVISTETHENLGLSRLNLPDGMISDKECPIKRQLKHHQIIPIGSTENLQRNVLIATSPDAFYRFRYCDLDYYRHVNTVRYVVLILNQLPLEKYDKQFVRRLELSFMHEAKYGMEVLIRRTETSEGENSFLLTDKDERQSILFARLKFSDRFQKDF